MRCVVLRSERKGGEEGQVGMQQTKPDTCYCNVVRCSHTLTCGRRVWTVAYSQVVPISFC